METSQHFKKTHDISILTQLIYVPILTLRMKLIEDSTPVMLFVSSARP